MTDEKKQSVVLRGEGGVEITFDLPLHPVYVEQINKGNLVPVDEKAAEKLAEAGVLQGAGAATADRVKAIEAREEAIAAKEAELAAREKAAAEAEAEPEPEPSPEPAPEDGKGKPKPKGKGA